MQTHEPLSAKATPSSTDQVRDSKRQARCALMVAALMLPTLAGCATTNLASSLGVRLNSNGRHASVFGWKRLGNGALFVAASPVVVTWDVVTFPFQIFGGFFPYGCRLKPEEDPRIPEHSAQ